MYHHKLSPPLPLLRFDSSLENQVKTVSGEILPDLPDCSSKSACSAKGDKLHDPVLSRKVARWLTSRCQQEQAFRQAEALRKAGVPDLLSEERGNNAINVSDLVVYESHLFTESPNERFERQLALDAQQEQMVSTYISEMLQSPGENEQELAGIDKEEEQSQPQLDEEEDRRRTVGQALMMSPSLKFHSHFESANLEKAVRVFGRETLPAESSKPDCLAVQSVAQEYDLTLRKDLGTDGNLQWYYFAVTAPERPTNDEDCYPLAVRFNITNLQKRDSLYNYGMRPAIRRVSSACARSFSGCRIEHAEEEEEEEDDDNDEEWGHGGVDICYYRNCLNAVKPSSNSEGKRKKKKRSAGPLPRSRFSLSFTIVFEQPCTLLLAHTYPYTYSTLRRYLHGLDREIQARDPDATSSLFFHRRNLCRSLGGNTVDLLTITERGTTGPVEARNKAAIIITARIHPGEPQSSYMMQGLIDYLVSTEIVAQRLRQAFIFLVVPMINPDGVIHGNTRCSLAATDLNRRFRDANPSLHPEVVAVRDLIRQTAQRRPVLLYLDLHGHSRNKNVFLYGCDPTLCVVPTGASTIPSSSSNVGISFMSSTSSAAGEDETALRRLHCRLYPRVLSTLSRSTTSNGYFSYSDCNFKISKGKLGTGRVVMWREMGVLGSYTVEASFCGNGDNGETKLLRKVDQALSSSATSTSSGVDGEGELTARSLLNKDPALQELVASYTKTAHYTKADLQAMGRALLLAVYHYANLTHADLDQEREASQASDRPDRCYDAPELSTASNTFLRSSTPSSPQRFPVSNAQPRRREQGLSSCQSTFPDENLPLPQRAKQQQQTEEEEVAVAVQPEDGNVKDADVPGEDSGNESSSTSSSSASRSLFVASRPSFVDLMSYEDNAAQKSLSRAGVFSTSALQSLLQAYAADFLILDRSTQHVGLRVKCELLLRRLLHVDDIKLRLDRMPALSALLALGGEEENGSEVGSDSQPSVDINPHAAKVLLRALRSPSSPGSVNNSVLEALRKVCEQRRTEQDAATALFQAQQLRRLKKEAQARAAAATPPPPAPASVAARPRPSTAPRPNRQVSMTPRSPLYRFAGEQLQSGAVRLSAISLSLLSSRESDRARAVQLQRTEMGKQHQHQQKQQRQQQQSKTQPLLQATPAQQLYPPRAPSSSVRQSAPTMYTSSSPAALAGSPADRVHRPVPLRASYTFSCPLPALGSAPSSHKATMPYVSNSSQSIGSGLGFGNNYITAANKSESAEGKSLRKEGPRLSVVMPSMSHNVLSTHVPTLSIPQLQAQGQTEAPGHSLLLQTSNARPSTAGCRPRSLTTFASSAGTKTLRENSSIPSLLPFLGVSSSAAAANSSSGQSPLAQQSQG
eukprot:gene10176-11260_t